MWWVILLSLQWLETRDLPKPQAEFGFVIVDDYVYTFCGLTGDYQTTGKVWYAKITEDGNFLEWTLTETLSRRQGISFTHYGGYIYVIGGQGPNGFYNDCYCAKIKGDHSLEPWQRMADLPEARDNGYAVAYDGYIYVIGGRNWFDSKNTVFYGKIEEDGKVAEWLTTTPLPEEVVGHACVVYDGYIYVIGGYDYNVGIKNKVFYAKIEDDHTIKEWYETTSLPLPLSGLTALVYNGKIYVFGGKSTNQSEIDSVYCAEIKEDHSLGEWKLVGVMPYKAHFLQSGLWKGYIYIAGGHEENGDRYFDYVYRTQVESENRLVVLDNYCRPGDNGFTYLRLINPSQSIGGLQFTLQFEDELISIDSISLTLRSELMDLNYHIYPGSLKVILYSLSNQCILPGDGYILKLYFTCNTNAQIGDSTLLHLKDVVACDPFAKPVDLLPEDGFIYFTYGKKGDVNCDGKIDVLDVVRCINIILGIGDPPTEYELWAADVIPYPSGDGEINILDAIGIVCLILGEEMGKGEKGRISISIGDLPLKTGIYVIPIEINSEVDISGLQFDLNFNPSQLEIEDIQCSAEAMEISYNSVKSGERVVIYSSRGYKLPRGNNTMYVKVKVNDVPIDGIEITNVHACNGNVELATMVSEREIMGVTTYPNPCGDKINIIYLLNKRSNVKITLYDIMGREIKRLYEGEALAGLNRIILDVENDNLKAGAYFVGLRAGGETKFTKILILK